LFVVAAGATAVLLWFLRTRRGTALRACGNNAAMMRALGVNVDSQIILGLALANGLAATAGALLAPDTLERAFAAGLRPADALVDNDGHGFFGALGDSVVTGPTLTNVNDFRAIVIDAPA
jgi:hydroxypyruvate reductase